MELVQVESQTQQIKLNGNVVPASGQKPLELTVMLQYTKRTFNLYGAICTLQPGFSCPFCMWSSFMRMKVASGSIFA